MQYYEKRISPFKSLALHRHVSKCADCREFFLEMTAMIDEINDINEIEEMEAEAEFAPEGFTEAVMAKVYELPVHVPKQKRSASDWLRIAGCIYALFMSIGIIVLYHAGIPVPDPNFSISMSEQTIAILNQLSQAGQYAMSYTTDILSGLGRYTLGIALVLGVALTVLIMREKPKHE